MGKLMKAVAGCLIGGLTGLVLGKYGGQLGIGGMIGGVGISDIVSIAILGTIAFLLRSKETISTVMTVAVAFQLSAIVIKLVWQAIAIPT